MQQPTPPPNGPAMVPNMHGPGFVPYNMPTEAAAEFMVRRLQRLARKRATFSSQSFPRVQEAPNHLLGRLPHHLQRML